MPVCLESPRDKRKQLLHTLPMLGMDKEGKTKSKFVSMSKKRSGSKQLGWNQISAVELE
jgi:hypothetical protein